MKRCFYERNTGTVLYDLKREQRSTIEIAILDGGNVRVKVPVQMRESTVRKVLKEKAPWIKEQMTRLQMEKESRLQMRFRDGGRFYYLGETMELLSGQSQGEPVWQSENRIMIDRKITAPQKRQEYLEQWYRKRAKKNIESRVLFFADKVGETPNKVTVRTQKRRWGSCSSLGNLNFNWKLIMLPQEIIDYVVVHELCHLKEMNHSKNFWNQVERILPDYRKCKEWLKNNAWKVEWEQI